ncbi:GNAT family N-acetyltransferase [Xiamenia xianingshaonis]|uniref:GNAT family N-acetyltransferase n=1 Tax=Xiamenia xianingshaonis TaxID=2682776 RepID=UPI0028F7385E|nr:GNAT family N-acetyltransferase [Xiamenia xianingshaonis]
MVVCSLSTLSSGIVRRDAAPSGFSDDWTIAMTFETERLILRPWEESDADDLFRYASHPDVGPITGWPVHESVEDSRRIIRDVLSALETYAVVRKGEDRPVGSVGLMLGKASNVDLPDAEGEIGFWIGVPYWGQKLILEATREIMRHGFEDLGLERIWCGTSKGTRSRSARRRNAGSATITPPRTSPARSKAFFGPSTSRASRGKNGRGIGHSPALLPQGPSECALEVQASNECPMKNWPIRNTKTATWP